MENENPEQFEVSLESIINDILGENRKLALEAATLRAAIADIKAQADALSQQINGGNVIPAQTEE